ncbi:pantetheine-phosphate adenylyltransferase, partial [Crocinitomicaceae bacterium]|nr:pantetheine-phosphate adenylyltransferase [Crocinitomicaceae bacterium]
QIYCHENRVSIKRYTGLTVEFCKEVSASQILRGLRNSIDFEYEKPIAQLNRSMSGIETLFIVASEQFSPINSSIVREIHKNKGDISLFVTHPEILV